MPSHWRSLVAELISVCYRMSDVVSPVVQSSSPEGLIPMDTESGRLLPLAHSEHSLKRRMCAPAFMIGSVIVLLYVCTPSHLCVCVWGSSETSAGLQRILQEIQPRDSNDFFTSPRELNPQTVDRQTVDRQTVDRQTVDPQTVDPQTVDRQTVDPQTVDPQTGQEERTPAEPSQEPQQDPTGQ